MNQHVFSALTNILRESGIKRVGCRLEFKGRNRVDPGRFRVDINQGRNRVDPGRNRVESGRSRVDIDSGIKQVDSGKYRVDDDEDSDEEESKQNGAEEDPEVAGFQQDEASPEPCQSPAKVLEATDRVLRSAAAKAKLATPL